MSDEILQMCYSNGLNIREKEYTPINFVYKSHKKNKTQLNHSLKSSRVSVIFVSVIFEKETK